MNLPQDSSSKPLAYQPVSYQEPQLPDLLAWAHPTPFSWGKESNKPLGMPKPTFMAFHPNWERHGLQRRTGRD